MLVLNDTRNVRRNERYSARSVGRPRGDRADLGVAAAVFAVTTVVLLADRDASLAGQRLLGLGTWVVLLALGRRERPLVRAQIAVVVVLATAVEYTFAAGLEVYSYRFENVPAFVPPGHGLVYLCALALGRTVWVNRHQAGLVLCTVAVGGSWAVWGLIGPGRTDVLGAFWFACLLGFLWLGRSRTLYLGAFAIVSYVELLGTSVGAWTWAAQDPTGLVSIGNPPSGAAGGYGWFDLAALALAPGLLAATTRLRERVPCARRISGRRRGSAERRSAGDRCWPGRCRRRVRGSRSDR